MNLSESYKNRMSELAGLNEKFWNFGHKSEEPIHNSNPIPELIESYLPYAPEEVRGELALFINNNIDLEMNEIENFLKIISKIPHS